MDENIVIKNVIGFNEIENQFQKIISTRKNQTWMLIGKRGIGKRTISMRFAGYVINNFETNWNTTSLTDDLFNKKSDNLHYITSLHGKNSGKISKEQIDIMSSKFKLFSSNSNNRVVIIDKFNWLTNNAMNSMLKILEEPPKGVYFFLIIDELKNILPTVQSRSQKLFFKNLSLNDCKNIIIKNNLFKNEPNLEDIIKLSNYSPGLSLEILSISGVDVYKELLNTISKKDEIMNFSRKINSLYDNKISNIWIIEYFLKRLLSKCFRFLINYKSIENSILDKEIEAIKSIYQRKKFHELLEILDDLNYRINRVKNYNLSLEIEIYQFLNKFH